MKELVKKIESLGGVIGSDKNDLIKIKPIEWFTQFNIDINDNFIKFIETFGGKSFIKNIIAQDVRHIPKSGSKGEIPFSIILGFTNEFNITEIKSLVTDNLQDTYIPFGIGEPTGDYWVYNTLNGEICFWIHDSSNIENSIYHVSDNINDFILSLTEEISENTNNEIIDFWISDDL